MRAKRKKLTCKYCGATWSELVSQLKQKGKGNYCSRECMYAARRKGAREKRSCKACGADFWVGGRARPGEPQRSRKTWLCSMECQRAARFRRGPTASELSPTDAAYLAGLFDGEGSVMIVRRRDAFALRLNIANTNKAALEWVHRTVGAGLIAAGKRQSEWHQPIWAWRANGMAAESVLRQIAPLMRIKHRQAALGLEFHERLKTPALKADRGWQAEMFRRMKDMNARGRRAVELAAAATENEAET